MRATEAQATNVPDTRLPADRRRRLISVLRILDELGSLIVFWILMPIGGIRLALAGSIGFIVLDGLRRWHAAQRFTRLWLLSSGLTMVFGSIDLTLATPVLIAYEAVITNVATGIAFVIGARGPRSIIQELAEQRGGAGFPDRADVRRFFTLFTLAWACYFFIKAALYFWIVQVLPLTEAMAVRSAAGTISLVIMIAVSVTQGRRLFLLCRKLRLLPAVPEGTGA